MQIHAISLRWFPTQSLSVAGRPNELRFSIKLSLLGILQMLETSYFTGTFSYPSQFLFPFKSATAGSAGILFINIKGFYVILSSVLELLNMQKKEIE